MTFAEIPYHVLATVAESAMPKIRNAIEMIQYAVFPLIVAVAVAAAHGALPIIRAWVMSMVWIQLWPPLYAIVHYIQTSAAAGWGASMMGLAESMGAQDSVIQAAIDQEAVAGMLVIAIPPIAAALVKGGEVGLQAVAGLMSAPASAAKAAAEIGAMGNLSAGRMDMRGGAEFGAPVQRIWQPDGSALIRNADGSIRYDAGTAMDGRMPISVTAAGREAASFSRAAESFVRAAATEIDRAIESRAAAFEKLFSREHDTAGGSRITDARISAEERAYREASAELQKVVDSYADRHSLSQSQRAALAAFAEGRLTLGGKWGGIGPLIRTRF